MQPQTTAWPLGASSIVTTAQQGFTEEAFAAFAQAGIPYMELSAKEEMLDEFGFLENPQRLLRRTAPHVQLWSMHVPFSSTFHAANLDDAANRHYLEKCTRYIEAGCQIGIRTFVLHPSSEPNDPQEREAKIRRAIANMTVLAALCRRHGAVLAVEDLPRTCLCNCAQEIIRFVQSVPDLQICFDTNHLTAQSNAEFLQALREANLTGKIRTVHISDYDGIDERHRLPLDGINDWKMIFEQLRLLEYRGVFLYEVSKPRDRAQSITPAQIVANYQTLLQRTSADTLHLC